MFYVMLTLPFNNDCVMVLLGNLAMTVAVRMLAA